MADGAPKKKGGLKLGSKVWVKDVDVLNPDVFVLATLQGISGKMAQIKTDKGDSFETDVFFPANPPSEAYSDHTALVHLSDATLLANTKARYAEDDIYTFVGPILVSVNPFKYIARLYEPELMAKCKKYAPGHPERPAHTFSMAEAAYQQMIKQKHSQSLVVSGESGAGKTEVNKQCMNYLVWRACDESSDLANRILESNPVLEAMGNAKTVRNNNSSRFGKFVTMQFDQKARLKGAEMQTFLLEKSRVVSTTATAERSYHIFYHVLCGSGLLDDKTANDMRLLNRSGCTSIPVVDDAEEYKTTEQALLAIGIESEEVLQLIEIIAGILCLGSIEFGDADNDATATISDPDSCSRGAELLGVTAQQMEEALLKATLKVSKSESYTIELDPAKATAGRDAFCKALYQRLFDHLVARVNRSLSGVLEGDEEDEESAGHYIGLLDVFGFEIFELNSFEQLCINFANEKLQNFFLRAVFKAEELAYKNDGIRWEAIQYTDNSAIIEIIEGKEKGIYTVLDTTCKAPKATDETLCTALHENHGRSKILCRPKTGGGGGKAKKLTDREAFILKHFAGDVTYVTYGWLEKNNDKLSDDYEAHLKRSSKELINSYIAKQDDEEEGGRAKKGKAQQTVSRGFLASLKRLMDALESTDAHFIRCIKPNNELKPNQLYGAFVLTQLKCSGTLEAVDLMQRGYPSRIPYSSIHERYKVYMPDFVQALEPSEFVEAIALAFGVEREDYQLGLHKIFMRAGKAAFLEELKDADIDEMVPIIVEKIRQFEMKKAAKKVILRCLSHWIFRRRLKKIIELKKKTRKAKEAAEKAKKKDKKGKKMSGDDISSLLEGMKPSGAKEGGKKTKKLTRGGGGGGGRMVPQQSAGPMSGTMAYGARVVSRHGPVDPNDKSAFTINVPQGAKSIIKQAVEEYKQTNDMDAAEIALLEKFLANLGTAQAPTTIFGTAPNAPETQKPPQLAEADSLMDEITDAPQLFEYDDIAHSGHLLMKVVELSPPKTKKPPKKKKDEWTLEYFILLNTKHIVHFQPNTGFIDPFSKTIQGKAIDLMQAQVQMTTELEPLPSHLKENGEEKGFELRTARVLYLLRQQNEKESSSETWVEKITEVMLASGEGEDGQGGDREYNDFLTGYNDVKPDEQPNAA